MGDSAPNTGYEPKLANFFSYTDPEHTPVDIPDSHHDFLCPDDVTMIPTSPDGSPKTEAFSSSQKATAGRVSSLFGPPGLGKLRAGHVSGRAGLQETGAELDRESVATTLFRSQSKGERDRDTKVVHSLRDRENHQKILERKVDLAVRGEREAQQQLYQAEAEVEVRSWEKSNSDFAFQEINQEFESQRFQLHQASRWADQAQRVKVNLYGELELRNRLFQENHVRECQEIKELRRICCEETDQARQARSEELSMQQQRNPAIVSQMMAQIRDLRNKVNSLSDARGFYDPGSGSSSGATHVPDQTSTILRSRTLPRCDSGLPRNTQNCTGIMGNVFERPPAQEGLSSTVFHHLRSEDLIFQRQQGEK